MIEHDENETPTLLETAIVAAHTNIALAAELLEATLPELDDQQAAEVGKILAKLTQATEALETEFELGEDDESEGEAE